MNDEYKPFSEREGYTPPKILQKEVMSAGLRNGLWNAFYKNFPREYDFDVPLPSHYIHRMIHELFWENPIDEYSENKAGKNLQDVKRFYQYAEVHRVLGLIEFVIQNLSSDDTEIKVHFVDLSNVALARENFAYRIVGGILTSIIEEHEIAEIETAMQVHGPSKEHIKKAYVLFSDRENPHYENSIKESISAVESIAKEITGKTDKPLNALTQQLKLHPNLTNALNELYNWTSKDGGIRHSKSEKSLTPDQDTARYMLVICSAFVNYVIAKGLKKP